MGTASLPLCGVTHQPRHTHMTRLACRHGQPDASQPSHPAHHSPAVESQTNSNLATVLTQFSGVPVCGHFRVRGGSFGRPLIDEYGGSLSDVGTGAESAASAG